jgi:hypothetical protein
MSALLNRLTKYGPVSVERHADQWRVGCLVKLPADVQESYIASYSRDLPTAIKKLLKTAPLERQKLWKKQKRVE